MDDSSNEPVTSTTHDDESAAVSGAVEALASEIKFLDGANVVPNNDDLKVMSYLFFFHMMLDFLVVHTQQMWIFYAHISHMSFNCKKGRIFF